MQTLTPQQQKVWNEIILDVLREFIALCQQHGLTYYCCGGTAIGAARHQGMIPWDDDIDVFMPRPDYDRFMEIGKTLASDKYEVLTPYNTPDYSVYFAKLCNKHTSLVEAADHPCILGLYIDIFPLDGASPDKEEAQRQQARFRREMNKLEAISSRYSFADYLSLLRQPAEWGRFARKTIGFFLREAYRRRLLARMEAICRRYPYDSSTLVMAYGGSYGPREVFPKAWAEGGVSMPFDGLTVSQMSGYDHYLRQIYGDYMQLPPEEKRASHHTKAYFNFDRRVTWKEACKAMRQ